jgi:hypothetical protein
VNIHKATHQYEEWLSAFMPLIPADLERKHRAMASAPFPFLRATFYRWAQTWPKVCKHLAASPVLLAVGDLHIENFGTWRDTEGRLIWGINDFDEAAYLPYTIDLVRLTTSAYLAIQINHLRLSCQEAATAILRGYQEGIQAGGQPYVLAEQHQWLRHAAAARLANPVPYWQKLEAWPVVKPVDVPETAAVALEHMLPQRGLAYTTHHRIAGLGSLGRPRYMALADWHGGKVARETKALAPSAAFWAEGKAGPVEIYYEAIVDRAMRCRDPFLQLQGRWIVRRIAPDCSRIDLESLSTEKPEAKLLQAMGWETANVHLGTTRAIKAVKKDLEKQPVGWLHAASEAMLNATIADWESWRDKFSS